MGLVSHIKNQLYRVPFFVSILSKLTNKLKLNGNRCAIKNPHFQHNTIMMAGNENQIASEQTSFIRDSRIYITGNSNTVVLEDGAYLYGEHIQSIHIAGVNNRVVIGANCHLTRTQFFISGNNNLITLGSDCSAYNTEFHIEQNGNEIRIGNGVTFHGRDSYPIHLALDEGSKIIIDEDCMFSNNIQMRSTDSHSIVDLHGNRLNPAKDIVIGKHCWLGLSCILLKGTEIAPHTVVAAGSVCSKNYSESNCIVAGNPAKVVKKEVDWDRKFILSES